MGHKQSKNRQNHHEEKHEEKHHHHEEEVRGEAAIDQQQMEHGELLVTHTIAPPLFLILGIVAALAAA